MAQASLYPSVVAISHVAAISVLSTLSSNTRVELEWRLTVRMCLYHLDSVPMFQQRNCCEKKVSKQKTPIISLCSTISPKARS